MLNVLSWATGLRHLQLSPNINGGRCFVLVQVYPFVRREVRVLLLLFFLCLETKALWLPRLNNNAAAA